MKSSARMERESLSMAHLYQLMNTWRELIVKFFSDYPLAAALVTLLAIGVFFLLQGEWRKGKTISNLLLVFIGWLALVPILGFAVTVLAKVWGFLETTVPWFGEVLGSTYRVYQHHPYLVLIIVGVGILYYISWAWWPKRPRFVRSRALKLLFVFVAIVIAVQVASPLADLISPSASAASQSAGSDSKKSR